VTDANEREWLAERFEQHRARLRAVAHRILGSIGEAEDAVQDAWLRRHSADTTEVENLDAWLTTVVARVCPNTPRARERRREEPLEMRLSDPIVAIGDAVIRSRPHCLQTRSGTRVDGGARDPLAAQTARIRAP
jgi:DNA-directed RNA polymerase specialized sigma24 family protein